MGAILLLGAPQGRSEGTGRVYLYLGSALGLISAATLDGEVAEDNFGFWVTGVGDPNQDGDGKADIAEGAPYHSASTGQVEIVRGHGYTDGDEFASTIGPRRLVALGFGTALAEEVLSGYWLQGLY